MKLIVGGAFQGKRAFAMTLLDEENKNVIDGAQCELADVFQADMIDHFHMYIKRYMQDGNDPMTLAQELYEHRPDLIIVTNELGYGIVPMDPEDRAWREACGRVCTGIAGYSSEVYRVICGVGMPLKCQET